MWLFHTVDGRNPANQSIGNLSQVALLFTRLPKTSAGGSGSAGISQTQRIVFQPFGLLFLGEGTKMSMVLSKWIITPIVPRKFVLAPSSFEKRTSETTKTQQNPLNSSWWLKHSFKNH